MGLGRETPFETIESAYEYIDLLVEAIEEAQREVADGDAIAQDTGADRAREAIHLAAHKLDRLYLHMSKSRRILNDLRTLRRLLLEEREKGHSSERTQAARV